ncbi:FKBP-type peptidyl-prolyl cis-trans isomerase [Pseudomarimonas arenosa]|uniref:Peptidyl-prolyl cis-trans isomerase n=1 Tax=Pseudomarimonas arenosa TaxID=2774145 RepID=A0AAW3ZED9_9GAMM|nr:peptidylprolyl isomerase [Pseudomarimonas arenosa]MBD8524491.1 peptidylprolyl isomerase [Pseudomarimonas arenosa]
MQIASKTVASFHYTLTNDQGDVVDSSSGRDPLVYLHGAGNIVAGLEKAMEGRAAGDKFEVAVPPEQGYGLRDEQLVQQVPREAFQGVDTIEVGMHFQASGPHGVASVEVTEVNEQVVTVDANHPLAGQTLHFAIEVMDVRQAQPEELEHGHVHGAGGHHH